MMSNVEQLVAKLQKDKNLERLLLRLTPDDHAAITTALQRNPVIAAQLKLFYGRIAAATSADDTLNLLGAMLQFGVTLGYLMGKPEGIYVV